MGGSHVILGQWGLSIAWSSIRHFCLDSGSIGKYPFEHSSTRLSLHSSIAHFGLVFSVLPTPFYTINYLSPIVRVFPFLLYGIAHCLSILLDCYELCFSQKLHILSSHCTVSFNLTVTRYGLNFLPTSRAYDGDLFTPNHLPLSSVDYFLLVFHMLGLEFSSLLRVCQ